MKNNKIIYVEDTGINRNNIITPDIKPLDKITIMDENKETYYECIYIPMIHKLNKDIRKLYLPDYYIHTNTWSEMLLFHGKIKRTPLAYTEYFWYGRKINKNDSLKKIIEIKIFL